MVGRGRKERGGEGRKKEKGNRHIEAINAKINVLQRQLCDL
jgi:hypothetical protein